MFARNRIFISYRHKDDKNLTERICDKLQEAYGKKHVFMDYEILVGEEWERRLKKELRRCSTVIVVIGPDWSSLMKEKQRAITPAPKRKMLIFRKKQQAIDYVVWELYTAKKRNKHIMPLLLPGASFPVAQDLPREIAFLEKHQYGPALDPKINENIIELNNTIKLLTDHLNALDKTLKLATPRRLEIITVILAVAGILFIVLGALAGVAEGYLVGILLLFISIVTYIF